MKSYWMAGDLIREREGDLDTERAMWRWDRDGRDAATSQGIPGDTRNWRRQGKILP